MLYRQLHKFITVFWVAAIAACSQPQGNQVTVDHNGQPISPDEIVTLSQYAFGCKMKFDLAHAAEQYNKHEYAAWARTTSTDNGCFSRPPADLKWTVYEIDYPAISVGFGTLSQYEAAHNSWPSIDARGVYWVPSGYVSAAKEK